MPFTDATEPAPPVLRTDEFTLRPITADDVELDYAAVMETREYLRQWQGSTWPEDDFTVEGNLKDLVDMQERHIALRAFSYTVLDPEGAECLGCVYVFPTTATFLTEATVTRAGDVEWSDVDAVVFFWARLSRMATGMDARLLAALRSWFADDWHVERTVYATNSLFTQQVELLERTDLRVLFELDEPGADGVRLVFG